MILLRFRDIGVNDGETINLHSGIAEKKDFAWWGWIRREGHEECPWDLLVQQSRRLVEGPLRICFIHTGINDFYTAELSIIHAHPKGESLSTPELGRTPRYMHERKCAAWFGVRNLKINSQLKIKGVLSCPTLKVMRDADEKLMSLSPVPAIEFGHGSSTLWEVEL